MTGNALRRSIVFGASSQHRHRGWNAPLSWISSSAALCPLTVSCGAFHSGLDAARIQRLRSSSVVFNRLRGRDVLSIAFEKRITLQPMHGSGDVYRGIAAGVAVVLPVSKQDVDGGCIPLPSVCPLLYDRTLFPLQSPGPSSVSSVGTGPDAAADDSVVQLPPDARRFLRRDADSFRIVLPAEEGRGGDRGVLVLVVDPTLDVPQYRREEAQVEMITAYRNVLCEVAESMTDAKAAAVSTLRIPVLCAYTAGAQFEPQLAKLTQQAIIKAFHRVSNAVKETLMMHNAFRIELYVPPMMLGSFESAFLEEAWAPPTSTVTPGRLNLYPGLAPPEKLLELEGWVGRRHELVEAVATGGKSLEATAQLTLDGRVVAQDDAHASIDVFGGRAALKDMLEGERKTAEARGLKKVFDEREENSDVAGGGCPPGVAPHT